MLEKLSFYRHNCYFGLFREPSAFMHSGAFPAFSAQEGWDIIVLGTMAMRVCIDSGGDPTG